VGGLYSQTPTCQVVSKVLTLFCDKKQAIFRIRPQIAGKKTLPGKDEQPYK
jgi:hypothetical protein